MRAKGRESKARLEYLIVGESLTEELEKWERPLERREILEFHCTTSIRKKISYLNPIYRLHTDHMECYAD